MKSGGYCDKLGRNAPMGPEGTSVIRVEQIAPKWEGGPSVVRPSVQLEFVRHLCLYLKPPSFKIFSQNCLKTLCRLNETWNVA